MITLSTQVTTRRAARGESGVAAARLESTMAGIEMYELGGNAVDAAVAAALVAGVVEPMETTLGGSSMMVVKVPDADPIAVGAGPRAPLAATPTMFTVEKRANSGFLGLSTVVDDKNSIGALAAGVPRALPGLIEVQERFGKLTRDQVMGPAIRAAADGFRADSYFTLAVSDYLQTLRRDPSAASRFLVDGEAPKGGYVGRITISESDLIVQPELARTLEILAREGAQAMYDGEIARAYVESVREGGGLLTAADMERARPDFTPALRVNFEGHAVWSSTAPSGGLSELQLLKLWGAVGDGLTVDSPEGMLRMADAMWHVIADRYHWLGDPEVVPVPTQGLLSDGYIREVAGLVRSGATMARPGTDTGLPWHQFAFTAVHDPWAYDEVGAKPTWSPDGGTEPTSGTTHISALDDQGIAVSITHTAANLFGAKVLCPRTGLLMDAAMGWFNAVPGAANSIRSGARPLSNMGPLVVTKDGKAEIALGAPGGRRIVCALPQVLINLLQRNMTVEDALSAPRIDASGTTLLVDERLGQVASQLPSDIPVTIIPDEHDPFGYEFSRPVAVVVESTGVAATTDPRVKGYGATV